MQHGKKSFISKTIIKAILGCKKMNIIFIFVFFELLEYLRPVLSFRLRRRGKIKYKVPIPIKPKEQYRLVFRWVLNILLSLKERQFYKRLIFLAEMTLNKDPRIQIEKTSLKKELIENRVFMHFRW